MAPYMYPPKELATIITTDLHAVIPIQSHNARINDALGLLAAKDREIELLKNVLKFYANSDHYCASKNVDTMIALDGGYRARRAVYEQGPDND